MAKAREIEGLTAELSFRDAAARSVSVRAREVFTHAEGVLDIGDIERVHDMRVATRRLRAVLEIFASCFPKRDHRALLREVKALADALGERRDRDVAIDSLQRIAAALGSEERPGINHLVDDLRAEQQNANVLLAGKLEEIERDRLKERLLALAAIAGPPSTNGAGPG